MKVKRLTQIGLGLAILILFLLPGQNDYQTLVIRPQPAKVRGSSITLNPTPPIPVLTGTKAPFLTARAVIVMDAASGTVLYQKNPDTPLFPASTTKIMTALVALEAYPLDQVLTVKQADAAIGQNIGLKVGESITAENLLYGLLVKSGNDAALALAENYPQSYSAFIDRMNQKAQDWHLNKTQFKNVSGVEQWGHQTTVRDLAVLTKQAMRQETFAQMVATPAITVTDITGQVAHQLKNINQLLGVIPGLRGVKTGWTESAGECLVTDTVRDGHEIIIVVLGSQDRFGESAALIDWAFANHQWQPPESIPD